LNGMVSKKKILKLTRLPNRSGSVSNWNWTNLMIRYKVLVS
jgi:hypothetical protein